MMTLDKIDLSQQDYTDEELGFMGKVLIKADAIRADKQVLSAVEKHMSGEAKKVRSIADLRKRASAMGSNYQGDEPAW